MLHSARIQFGGNSGFTPVTRTFTSGAGNDTVPAGATLATMRAVAPGGSGGKDSSFGAGGGGAGATCTRSIAVIGGNVISYTLGVPGAGVSVDGSDGNDGTATTISGTVSGGVIALSAGGGLRGLIGLVGGAGGVASGGTTNTNGNVGSFGVGGASVFGGYGAGSNGRQLSTGSSNAGGSGAAIIEYS